MIDMQENIFFNPYAADGYNRPKHKNAKIFENYLNPVLLVFIG